MIRLAAERDLPSITGIYDAILDREEAGPAYTNWQRGKYLTKTPPGGPWRTTRCMWGTRAAASGAW